MVTHTSQKSKDLTLKPRGWEFPDGPLVRNPSSHCQRPGFELESHSPQGAAKKQNKKTKTDKKKNKQLWPFTSHVTA